MPSSIKTEPWLPFPCDICGNDKQRFLGERSYKIAGKTAVFEMSYHDVSCASCGFVYEGKRPSEDFLFEYYADAHDTYSSDVPIEVDYNVQSRIDVLKDHLAPGARIAEIGAGAGHFCRDMIAAGYDAIGIDPKRQEERPGIVAAFVNEEGNVGAISGRDFDAVVSYYVMEHVRDPRKWLVQISQNLKPGGLLVIEVPNFSSHPEASLHCEHMTHFSPIYLEELLSQHGYEIQPSGRYSPSRYFGMVAVAVLKNPAMLSSPRQCSSALLVGAEESAKIYARGIAEKDKLDVVINSVSRTIRDIKVKNPAMKICFWGVNEYSHLAAMQLTEFGEDLVIMDNSNSKIGQVVDPFPHPVIKPDRDWCANDKKVFVLCSPLGNPSIKDQILRQDFKNYQLLDATILP